MAANPLENRQDFSAKQREFAAFIRDPEHRPAPSDVKKERMLMYRELFFNNIEGFLSDNFPVLRSLFNEYDWFSLVQDFFSSHACRTPYFSEIPEEFLDYLQNERNTAGDLPFLLELAHYEWAEMVLAIAQETTPDRLDADIDPLQAALALSPLAWPLAYHFPVHRISSEFVPTDQGSEQATFLVMMRDDEDNVNFWQITPMTYNLLTAIQNEPGHTGAHYLQQLAAQAGMTDPAPILEHGRAILQDMSDKIIVYNPSDDELD